MNLSLTLDSLRTLSSSLQSTLPEYNPEFPGFDRSSVAPDVRVFFDRLEQLQKEPVTLRLDHVPPEATARDFRYRFHIHPDQVYLFRDHPRDRWQSGYVFGVPRDQAQQIIKDYDFNKHFLSHKIDVRIEKSPSVTNNKHR